MIPTPLSALVVDDEKHARELLVMLLNEIEGIKIAGEADNVQDAYMKVLSLNPDIIFIDIKMPDRNGFDLIKKLREKQIEFRFIFVTAYEDYAIKAIKNSAFDYLLKPIDPDELAETIGKFRFHLNNDNSSIPSDYTLRFRTLKKIRINTQTGYILISPEEIIYATADGNYTDIHLVKNRMETTTINLGRFSNLLPENKFFRISRSTLINLSFISQVNTKECTCKVYDDTPILLKISKRRLKQLSNIWDYSSQRI